MKAKKKDMHDSVSQSDSEMLALIAAKLKGRVLFPDKVEETRKFFSQIKTSTL